MHEITCYCLGLEFISLCYLHRYNHKYFILHIKIYQLWTQYRNFNYYLYIVCSVNNFMPKFPIF